jgi:hypothetical protein
MMEGVNSTMIYMIYCKNFSKCHNVPPPSTIIKKKERKKKDHSPGVITGHFEVSQPLTALKLNSLLIQE